MITGKYPSLRLRRNRKTSWSRRLIQENTLTPNDFILPINTNVLKRTHIFNFNGVVITDDLMRSQDSVYTTYAKKRFLYLYHLDWPYIQDIRFAHLKKVLMNDNICLIARSDSHASLIEQHFKKPDYIMPEWDYKTLIEIDNNEQ